MKITTETGERHVLAVTVDNEAGILAKITGLFSARGYNIESLTVADISADHALSRITIVTSGPPAVIDQIIAQLDRLVPVHQVTDLTDQRQGRPLHRADARMRSGRGRPHRHRRHRPRAGGALEFNQTIVIPAKAGTQGRVSRHTLWVPAFAGMTNR